MIKRYSYEWAGLWVINTHNGYKDENKKQIPPINIAEYPSLKKHLNEFYPQLEKRADKGITLYNLRNCAYIEEFEKEKIIYLNMNKEFIAFFDTEFFLLNQKCFILSHQLNDKKELLYLTALLNSNIIFYYMQQISSNLGDGAFRWIKQYVEKLPIPKINSKNEKSANELVNLVDEILKAKEKDKNANTSSLEEKINSLVYKFYNLTEEEIKIIENKE